MKTLLQLIPNDRTEINSSNTNPIPMEKFLSFLTIDVTRITDHLGSCTGWTRYESAEHKLIIMGGNCDGGEWLHNIQYGNRLHNSYNNYVNALYLSDIMTDEGKEFFHNYYANDIEKAIEAQEAKVRRAEQLMKTESDALMALYTEKTELSK